MAEKEDITHILIIDDDEFVRESFASFLQDLGYHTQYANNGTQGLKAFKKHQPDIVLLDLRMPGGMDGLEVLSAIREEAPDIPVLVISGTGDMTDAISALRLGAWNYLEKPLPDFDMLTHAIDKALERSALIKENERYKKELEALVNKRTAELKQANLDLNNINQRLRQLVQAINRLTDCPTTMELCKKLIIEIGMNMSADGGSIYLFEGDHLKLCHSLDPDHTPESIKLPMETNCLFCNAVKERKPLIFNKLDSNDRIQLSGWKGYKSQSALILPVLGDPNDTPLAIISLHDKMDGDFTSQDLEISQILVSYAFRAISAVKTREQLEASEVKFRTVVENLHGGILVTDDQFRLIYNNKELPAMLGDPKLDLIGQDFRKYLGEKSLSTVVDRYIRRQRGESLPAKYELTMQRVTGEKRHVEISASVLENAQGKMETYAQLIDVTDRKLAEESLKQALNELENLKNRLQDENVYLREELKQEFNPDQMIVQSSAFKRIIQNIELIAPNDSTILIHGETGTGKELIARVIHEMSLRKHGPMVKVNCAALQPNLIESELFGHEKGSFTGAHARRKGRFELASGGTLFLDEIGELPLELQTKLLRVLQEGEFERVGGEETIQMDVRIIAATNRNLQKAIKEGQFRSDLFYRLNVIPIELPPLRERKDDIVPLALFFARKYGKKQGKYFNRISEDAKKTLMRLDWPGNIRELENVIERMVVFCEGPELEFEQPVFLGKDSAVEREGFETLEAMERRYITEVLEAKNWVIEGIDGAAGILNLHPNTLRSRMKKLAIKKPRK